MQLIAQGLDVRPIELALDANPHLWDQYGARTQAYEHSEVSDIWVRYAAQEALPDAYKAEHESIWYPAADALGLKAFLLELTHFVGGTRLGGVLITRIPAGGKVQPHIDSGWHAGYYEKFAVQIRGDFKQAFCFEGESFSALPGDVYRFDNSKLHWVTNDSEQERITLIVCIRRS